MAQAESGQSSAPRLRVACWGDPGLQGNRSEACQPHIDCLRQPEGTAVPMPVPMPVHDLEAYPHAVSPGLSASYPPRPDSQRWHNLRPRSGPNSASQSVKDEADFDEMDEVDCEYGDESGDDSKRRDRKKVGRPIAYTGDPDSPHLTEADRRKLRRRVANRESARRVRNKRQEIMDELHKKVTAIQTQNQELVGHITDIEHHKGSLVREIQGLRGKWNEANLENARLRQDVASMRRQKQGQHGIPPASSASRNGREPTANDGQASIARTHYQQPYRHDQEQQLQSQQHSQNQSLRPPQQYSQHYTQHQHDTQHQHRAQQRAQPDPQQRNNGSQNNEHVAQHNALTGLGLSLPTAGSSFELPSLLQLTPTQSRELFTTSPGENGLPRQSSVQPPPDTGRLPNIQPLTGLQRLSTPLNIFREAPHRHD